MLSEENFNEGASTSSAAQQMKQEKKKSVPWIEKYRPQVFEDIMGKKNLISMFLDFIQFHQSRNNRQ